ncbi:MAG: phospholipase D-like domain-containing protein [Nocardioides sp.]
MIVPRLWTWLKRGLLVFFGLPIAVGVGMSVVDSYRRRGRKPKPFPISTPRTVQVGDGEITTYTYGQDLYDDMLEAINGATRTIMFETYIWKSDEVGHQFKNALIAAAARGVAVHVIYDRFANLVVSPRFKRFPHTLKVLHYPIWTAGWRVLDLSRQGRDHRKILVVDDGVGFVGGYNIGAAYATEWRDTHIRVTGPAVAELERAFADFWNLFRRRLIGQTLQPLLVDAKPSWEPTVRFQRNIPRLSMYPIRSMYLEAINRASTNIWVTQAYFLPDQDFVEALTGAARRGVDVRLLLPIKSNHIVADWISRGYFSQMLEAGVRILRFRDAMVHAKTATVDGTWVTVGTANIDRLSLQGNYEINVEVISTDLARVMEDIFLLDESNSLLLSQDEWDARDVHRKFTEMLLQPLRRFL